MKNEAKKNSLPKKIENKKAAQKPVVAPATDAPATDAPVVEKQKPWQKYQDKFEKVETSAEVPGVGTIKVTLIQVTFKADDGTVEVFRATTRKDAQIWIRNRRKAAAAVAKTNSEAAKAAKALARAEKIAPYVTERLGKFIEQLNAIAGLNTVTDGERKDLAAAVANLNSVVESRKAASTKKEE